jgi:hypothetical protein
VDKVVNTNRKADNVSEKQMHDLEIFQPHEHEQLSINETAAQ